MASMILLKEYCVLVVLDEFSSYSQFLVVLNQVCATGLGWADNKRVGKCHSVSPPLTVLLNCLDCF